MLICIQIVFPSLVQPLKEQEEFGCSTSHRTQANHWLTVGWMEIKKEMGRLVGGRDRDRKNIRVEKRNPQNSNHSLRSQAGNRCEERGRESRRRLLAGALTSVPRDRPLRYLIQTWSWASAKNLPSRSPLGQALSHTHPWHTAFPPRNPFSDLTSPTAQAQSRAPYSKGRVLRPEAGSRKWGCEDVFWGSRRPARPASWSRCTNKRTSEGCVGERAGLGPGGPGARGFGDCHCGGRAVPPGAAPHLSAPSGMASAVRGGWSGRQVLDRVAPAAFWEGKLAPLHPCPAPASLVLRLGRASGTEMQLTKLVFMSSLPSRSVRGCTKSVLCFWLDIKEHMFVTQRNAGNIDYYCQSYLIAS